MKQVGFDKGIPWFEPNMAKTRMNLLEAWCFEKETNYFDLIVDLPEVLLVAELMPSLCVLCWDFSLQLRMLFGSIVILPPLFAEHFLAEEMHFFFLLNIVVICHDAQVIWHILSRHLGKKGLGGPGAAKGDGERRCNAFLKAPEAHVLKVALNSSFLCPFECFHGKKVDYSEMPLIQWH